jgi:hypothetical protein
MANRKSRKIYKRKQNKTKQNKYLKYKTGGTDNNSRLSLNELQLKIYTSTNDLIKQITDIRKNHPKFYMIISFYPPSIEDFPHFKRGDFYLIQSDIEDTNKFYMISNDSICEASEYNGLKTIYIVKPSPVLQYSEMSITRLLNNNIIHESLEERISRISRTSFKVQFFEGHFFNKENFPLENENEIEGTKYFHKIDDYDIDDDLLIPLQKCKNVYIPKEYTTTNQNNNIPSSEVTSMNSSPQKTSWWLFKKK